MARHWLEALLSERYGNKWIVSDGPSCLELRLCGGHGSIIFDDLCAAFTSSYSEIPFSKWNAEDEGWVSAIGGPLPMPGVASVKFPLIEKIKNSYIVHYDILGFTYWMLTRIEEIGRTDLDCHSRFPGEASHAFKHGYLNRPVVDEWLAILGQVIKRQWPSIPIKRRRFSIKVSHDVDQPSRYAFKKWSTIGWAMAGHLVKRGDVRAFFNAPLIKLMTRDKLLSADPFNTFDWLMGLSDANNLKSAFYFISGRTHKLRDADYDLDHPVIRKLMKSIHQQGHEVGLHPSYETYKDPNALKSEANKLKRVCEEEGIVQERWGGRMHYLRWEQPSTLNAWENIGFDYESSLGYADKPGFRCGTCHEYPAFDPVAQKLLMIRIRPLVVMECSVIDRNYLGLGVSEEAADLIQLLKSRCKLVGGTFTLLWHNSYLVTPDLKFMYKNIIKNN